MPVQVIAPRRMLGTSHSNPAAASSACAAGQVFGRDVRDQHVLNIGQAHFAAAVLVRDIGGVAHVLVGDPARQDAQADPVEAGLLLGIDAEMVAVGLIGELRSPARPDQATSPAFCGLRR